MTANGQTVPDVLGDAERAAVVRSMLAAIQRQLFTLEVEQLANDWPQDAPAPGTQPPTTIAARRAELHAAQERVLERYRPLLEATQD